MANIYQNTKNKTSGHSLWQACQYSDWFRKTKQKDRTNTKKKSQRSRLKNIFAGVHVTLFFNAIETRSTEFYKTTLV